MSPKSMTWKPKSEFSVSNPYIPREVDQSLRPDPRPRSSKATKTEPRGGGCESAGRSPTRLNLATRRGLRSPPPYLGTYHQIGSAPKGVPQSRGRGLLRCLPLAASHLMGVCVPQGQERGLLRLLPPPSSWPPPTGMWGRPPQPGGVAFPRCSLRPPLAVSTSMGGFPLVPWGVFQG